MSRIFKPDSNASVLVVGDLMLDRYVYGETRRISPEAPVAVVQVKQTESRPGGAANVAQNVSSYETACRLLGMTGDDTNANSLQEILVAKNIDCQFIRQSDMPTITKERVISQHQQLLRLDYEQVGQHPAPELFYTTFEQQLSSASAVLFSDYAKGCLASIERLIRLAKDADKFVLIDPKGIDFSRYSGADLLTPNLHEFEAVVGSCQDEQTLVDKAQNLCIEMNFNALLVTRGEQGMSLIQKDEAAVHLSTRAQDVFDVTGAGDTVIATMAVAIVSNYGLDEAMYYANQAAGLSVAKVGAVSITTQELNRALRPTRDHKIVNQEELEAIIEQARAEKKQISFTNGCFDILHAGHVAYLNQAATLADILIVGVNSDDSVRELKGETRPVNGLQQRLKVLAGLEAVDYVIAFNESTPESLIENVSPDFLVKGADYEESEIVGADFVKSRGGKVHRIPLEPDCSTTAIIEAVKTQ